MMYLAGDRADAEYRVDRGALAYASINVVSSLSKSWTLTCSHVPSYSKLDLVRALFSYTILHLVQ